MTTPLLSAVVVHWRNEVELGELGAAWPNDARFELLIVDNSASAPRVSAARLVRPVRNLGFAGGANLGFREARAPLVLLLNPDARPEPGALAALLEGFAAHPDAAGLAPRLLSDRGAPQWRWQLRPLPSLADLVAQAMFLPLPRGPRREPEAGALVEQPAAAALVLRRDVALQLGGFEESFFPAWFEDVDFARRLRDRGLTLRYWPAARFRHGLGASLARLGYGRFLWIYTRNLARYARRHHGRGGALAVRALVGPAALVRLLVLPLRRPRRAASRREAARGLLALLAAALTGWRRPTGWARDFAPPPG